MKERLTEILDRFKGKKILVIGDIMLDKYIFGKVDRISPEAPVQVVEVIKENYLPGGAANVASNVSALGGTVVLVGIIGNDNSGKILIEELKKRGIDIEGIFRDSEKPTIQKVRVLGQKQQLLRIDYEKKESVKEEIENKITNFLRKKKEEIAAVIISDYAKGIVTEGIMENLKTIFSDKTIIADPKPKNFDFYKRVSLVTPNVKEAKEMTNKENIEEMGKELIKKLNSSVLITRGEEGMSLFELNGSTRHIPTKAKEVYDVSGAGDTVVATLALALASNATIEEAAILANHAAGITVGKIGTSTVTIKEIKRSIENE